MTTLGSSPAGTRLIVVASTDYNLNFEASPDPGYTPPKFPIRFSFQISATVTIHKTMVQCELEEVDRFIYNQLGRNGSQIRLLTQNTDKHSYNLMTFNLEECPQYVALSYTWGHAYPKRTILLHRKPFEVRGNLWDFFEGFETGVKSAEMNQPVDSPMYLWVDQICMNRLSRIEKSNEVKLVAEIYKRAQQVLVWLGSGDSKTDRAMKLIAIAPSSPSWTLHTRHESFGSDALNIRFKFPMRL